MLTIGIDNDSVAFRDVLELNQTMNSDRYKNFLEHYVSHWEAEKGIRLPVILHDNARPHKSNLVQELIAQKGWSLLPHPPYSLDMNPCDLNCFGHLKLRLSGNRYDELPLLIRAIGEALEVIMDLNQNVTFTGVSKLPEVWERVFASEGDY